MRSAMVSRLLAVIAAASLVASVGVAVVTAPPAGARVSDDTTTPTNPLGASISCANSSTPLGAEAGAASSLDATSLAQSLLEGAAKAAREQGGRVDRRVGPQLDLRRLRRQRPRDPGPAQRSFEPAQGPPHAGRSPAGSDHRGHQPAQEPGGPEHLRARGEQPHPRHQHPVELPGPVRVLAEDSPRLVGRRDREPRVARHADESGGDHQRSEHDDDGAAGLGGSHRDLRQGGARRPRRHQERQFPAVRHSRLHDPRLGPARLLRGPRGRSVHHVGRGVPPQLDRRQRPLRGQHSLRRVVRQLHAEDPGGVGSKGHRRARAPPRHGGGRRPEQAHVDAFGVVRHGRRLSLRRPVLLGRLRPRVPPARPQHLDDAHPVDPGVHRLARAVTGRVRGPRRRSRDQRQGDSLPPVRRLRLARRRDDRAQRLHPSPSRPIGGQEESG